MGPIPLVGHDQEVESVHCDGHLVVSLCMEGRICVWDSLTGECIQKIRRSEVKSEPVDPSADPPLPSADDVTSEHLGAAGWTRQAFSLRFRSKSASKPSAAFKAFESKFKVARLKKSLEEKDVKPNLSRNAKECVWCLDVADGLVAVGTNTGRIEIWNGTTGELCCTYEDGK